LHQKVATLESKPIARSLTDAYSLFLLADERDLIQLADVIER
jgi:hypothetical protein